jgi:hypothetical protein
VYFPFSLLVDSIDLTFSSQVRGHACPVKCHAVFAAGISCIVHRAGKVQAVFVRRNEWCGRRLPLLRFTGLMQEQRFVEILLLVSVRSLHEVHR